MGKERWLNGIQNEQKDSEVRHLLYVVDFLSTVWPEWIVSIVNGTLEFEEGFHPVKEDSNKKAQEP